MNYREAIGYLQSFTDFEQLTGPVAANRFHLDRVVHLLDLFGHPERCYGSVHVVGTKGKGSTAAMIAACLREGGYCTGLYVSPHLHTFRERIRVDGEYIGEEELAALTELVKPLVDRVHRERPELGFLTTFEITTALAFSFFAQRGADHVVLEAGMGGRLDATNVVDSLVTVLTPIGLDHTRYLGETVAAIAKEKCAVIKPGRLVVSAEQPAEALAVVEETARANGAALQVVGREWTWREAADGAIAVRGPGCLCAGITVPLLGKHQKENATLAIAALDALRQSGVGLTDRAISRGIAAVKWPGRLEILRDRPLIVVDGAHNADSMRRLREALDSLFGDRNVIVVLGCSADKDLAGIVREIGPIVKVAIATRSRHARSADEGVIAGELAVQGLVVEKADSVAGALRRARELAGPTDLICVTGSLFVVAEAREVVLGDAAR